MYLFLLSKKSGLSHAHKANPLDHHICVFRTVKKIAFSFLGTEGALNTCTPFSIALKRAVDFSTFYTVAH
jgi:hypothetical protein